VGGEQITPPGGKAPSRPGEGGGRGFLSEEKKVLEPERAGDRKTAGGKHECPLKRGETMK